MSKICASSKANESNPWKRIAEHRETLEMCIEEETSFADQAETLLERLEEEGY